MSDVLPTDEVAETLRRRLLLLDQLIVTPTVAPDGLLVDASNIATDDDPVRHWQLVENVEGIWRHHESNTEGHLGHVLRAIAWSYDVEVPRG